MSKAEAGGHRRNFNIQNSLFDIRYSFTAHCKFIILQLPIAEELAQCLQIYEDELPPPDFGFWNCGQEVFIGILF
jgi:hypothetical protein